MKKVVIVGPGGLGGLVAALLARSESCEVTVVTRPGAHAEAMRRSGLQLEGLEEFTVHLDVVDDARQIERCDAMILAVKAQDTAAALQGVAHIQVDDFVASLQNSLIKDDILAATFGREKTIGVVAILAGERPRPELSTGPTTAALYSVSSTAPVQRVSTGSSICSENPDSAPRRQRPSSLPPGQRC